MLNFLLRNLSFKEKVHVRMRACGERVGTSGHRAEQRRDAELEHLHENPGWPNTLLL